MKKQKLQRRVYDRIDQKPTFVIVVSLTLSLSYAASSKLQTAVLSIFLAKGTYFAHVQMVGEITNRRTGDKAPPQKSRDEKARQRKNSKKYRVGYGVKTGTANQRQALRRGP